MSKTNKQSVADFDRLEISKRRELKTLTARAEELNAQRSDLLLALAGGDKSSVAGIDGIEKERKDISLQIEGIEALLKAVPKRRDYARADEIETEIKKIQPFDDRLIEAASKVDTAAEAFAVAMRDYYDIVEELRQINNRAFSVHEIGALDSLGVFLRKHDLWGWVKAGVFRNAKTMTDTLESNYSLREVRSLLSAMRTSAARLRGETVDGPEICPDCFGTIRIDYSTNDQICPRCGRREKFVRKPEYCPECHGLIVWNEFTRRRVCSQCTWVKK